MASILARLRLAGNGCVNIGSTNGRDAYTFYFQSDVGGRKGIQAPTYTMLTFHEFLAKKAMVYPDLFRIQPFV
jgi:hypothetical protein